MKSFLRFIAERYISIGLNPAHERYREKHRQEFHDNLHKSYSAVPGGYRGHGSGTEAESKAIHDDITDAAHIKATKRAGKITALTMSKSNHGRKVMAGGTDGSDQGKGDFRKIVHDDNTQKRAWGEFSGAAAAVYKRIGHPTVPSSEAGKLTGKPVDIVDKDRYSRDIGGKSYVKTILGHPK